MGHRNVAIALVAVACCPMAWLLPARAEVPEPNAAELVRAVRQTEMWMHDCESLHVRATRRWTRTPESVARWRAQAREESGVLDPDPRQFPNVRASVEESLEFAVDRTRVRYVTDDPGYWREVKVWDGNELRVHDKYYHQAQEQYVLDKEISEWTFHEMFPGSYGWPRSQPHSFWYDVRDVNNAVEFYGPAERFKLVGRETYRQTSCYVLEYEVPPQWNAGLIWRWFVGRSDGLLYGIQAVRHRQVGGEHWWSDYRQVVPGGWFPMKTGWSIYHTSPEGLNSLESWCEQEAIEFHINEPLADELFVLPIEPDKDGVVVMDSRSGKLQKYKIYKPWPSLVGKELPGFVGIEVPSPPAKGKPLLVVFVDLDQRSSRHAMQMLAAPEKSALREQVEIIPVQVAQMTAEKLDELSLPWKIATTTGDPDTIRRPWGAKLLPWLILTDRDHIVRAEGFSSGEIDDIVVGGMEMQK